MDLVSQQMQGEFFFGKKKRDRERDAQRGETRALAGNDAEMTRVSGELLDAQGEERLAEMVSVVWNKRMRSTAGRAFWPEMKVEINPKLKEIAPEQVARTLRHELAHLLAYWRAEQGGGRRNISAHGVEWQRACRDLGIPGERATHSLPLPSRSQRRKWSYTCPECAAVIQRVRRMKRSVACYPCCRRENRGEYSERFLLLEQKI